MPFIAATVSRCTRTAHAGERILPITDFYVNPAGRVNSWCRSCMRADAALRRVNGPRRPRNTGRKFGVEMECIVNAYNLQREMQTRGLNVTVPGYTHRIVAGQWKIVTDASVAGGYELVSPPLSGAAGMADLKKACESLEAAGARVNRACGLHVHHEVGDLNVAAFGRLLHNWANSQRGTDELVAPSRRNSQWAQPLNMAEVAGLTGCRDIAGIRSQAAYINRYRSLNVACFPRYGTVEVRQHQGTINFDKIASWVAFGQAMITAAKADAVIQLTTADLLVDALAAHGLTAVQVRYLKARAAHFAQRTARV